MNWLGVIRDWALREGVGDDLRVLDAFGWPEEAKTVGGADAFCDLEAEARRREVELPNQIATALNGEVDQDQAEMFGRRVSGVLCLMDPMASSSSWSRVLRVAFVMRILQVLDVSSPPMTKPPRALRVRAVADYYFSLAAVEFHRLKRKQEGVSATNVPALIDAATWREELKGLKWTTLEGALEMGPFRATVLVVDPDRFMMEAVKRGDACERGDSLLNSTRQSGALAATSGGFFLYSEPDIAPPSARYDPVGLLVSNGDVINPPCFGRVAFVQRRSGRCEIIRTDLAGVVLCCAGETICLDGVQWRAITRADGLRAPTGVPQIAIASGRVCAVSGDGGLSVPLNGLVLSCVHGSGVRWPVNAQVTFRLPEQSDPIENGMAGGPELLRGTIDLVRDGFVGTAPPRTFSGDETGDCNLLPRMAVGILPSGSVVFAAVDGRNFDRALGLTLAGLGSLMDALGCVRAMNLDGGSSKRIVIGDEVRDLPTTEVVGGTFAPVGVRPVRTALFWRSRRD